MLGISRRPLKSCEPGGSERPEGRTHLTLARIGPSSRHWKTTSLPVPGYFRSALVWFGKCGDLLSDAQCSDAIILVDGVLEL